MPDVLVEFQGLRTIIEGKVNDQPGAQDNVHRDAYKRVFEGLAHIGIAVLYPAELRKAPSEGLLRELIDSTTLQVEVITEIGSEGWTRARVSDLGDILRRTFEQLTKQDLVYETAANLKVAVDEFANVTVRNDAIIARAAKLLGIGEAPEDPERRRNARFKLQWREGVAKIAGLTILNAMIFHEILSDSDPEGRVVPIRGPLAAVDPISDLSNIWSFIYREIDYQPIFAVSTGLIGALPSSSEAIRAVRILGEKASEVLHNRTSMKHDLMGRVYHTLLADKKYLATYYTSVPAATMLLKVALAGKTWPMDWSSLDEIGALRVADLACGTGTLLMAAYEALTDNYVHACFKKCIATDVAASHKLIMEKVIYGYDVLLSALHLTASTLALRSSSVLFRRMNLYTLPLGGKAGRLGSIEFLNGNQIWMNVDLFESALQVTGTGDEESDKSHPIAPLPRLDLCVINPPFTRSSGGNLLFGSSPDPERRIMQDKLAALLKKQKVQASSTAGLGAVFVAIADRALKNGGRLALVLPKTLLSGAAWEKTRKLLAEKYVVETIIVSHDPARWNFSENTNLSELLLVARRVGNGNARNSGERVKCVNLWKNPETVFSALMVARQITEEEAPDIVTGHGAEPIEMGDTCFGELSSVNWSALHGKLWVTPFAFAQFSLSKIAYNLSSRGEFVDSRTGKQTQIALVPLGNLGSLGPDRRDIMDGFSLTKRRTEYPVFWGHDSEACRCIAQTPNRYLAPLPRPRPSRKLRKAAGLWLGAGVLLLSDCIRLNTQSNISILLDRKALSNVWRTITLRDDNKWCKPLSIWLNSTLGLLIMLCHRGETMGAWMTFKKGNLESLPVLDVRSLSETQLKILCDTFDEVASEPLLPFPQMESDLVRAKIDAAVSKALGLPDLGVYRMLLAQEPVVSLKALY